MVFHFSPVLAAGVHGHGLGHGHQGHVGPGGPAAQGLREREGHQTELRIRRKVSRRERLDG